jgi:hypothetical protein
VAERALLDNASAQEGEHPSDYGAAWVALGRAMLDTDLLARVRPGRDDCYRCAVAE